MHRPTNNHVSIAVRLQSVLCAVLCWSGRSAARPGPLAAAAATAAASAISIGFPTQFCLLVLLPLVSTALFDYLLCAHARVCCLLFCQQRINSWLEFSSHSRINKFCNQVSNFFVIRINFAREPWSKCESPSNTCQKLSFDVKQVQSHSVPERGSTSPAIVPSVLLILLLWLILRWRAVHCKALLRSEAGRRRRRLMLMLLMLL